MNKYPGVTHISHGRKKIVSAIVQPEYIILDKEASLGSRQQVKQLAESEMVFFPG